MHRFASACRSRARPSWPASSGPRRRRTLARFRRARRVPVDRYRARPRRGCPCAVREDATSTHIRQRPRAEPNISRGMNLGFGDAILVLGVLLAIAAALSGVMRGTVLSISVLSVALGIGLA